MHRSHYRTAAILLALFAAVTLPTLAVGYFNERKAQAAEVAGDQGAAAQSYARAARFLPWQPGLREKAGIAAEASGDHSGAITLLAEDHSHASLGARGYEALGSAYWATGSQTAAIAAWEAGTQLYPGDAGLWEHLVQVYRAQGDIAGEESALRQRLAIGSDAEAHYLLGTLLMLDDPAAARAELESAAKDSRFQPASETLLAAISAAQHEANAAARSIVLGRALGLVDEWALAGRAFSAATAANPRSAEAYAWLGEARQHLGEDGRPDLDHALLLGPNDSLVRVLRGMYFRRNADPKRALDEYLRATDLDPDNPVLLASLADAQAESGDLAAALTAYQKATEIAPESAQYWRLLAMFCADNSVQVLELGIPAAEKAVALAPDDAEALDALGWSYAQAGYLTRAADTLRRAARLSDQLAPIHLHLGQVYLRTGERGAAFDELQRAASLDQGGPYGTAAGQLLSQFFVVPAAPAASATP
jgi:protein O-GlcNAc transferase